MKKLYALVLTFAFVFGFAACAAKQVPENFPANDTQPTDIVMDETQATSEQTTPPTEAEIVITEPATEPQEQDPYEAYIATVPKGEYIYEDLNGDGAEELFIYRENSSSELLTLVDGELVSIMHEHSLFLCEDGIIGKFSEGSGGMTLFYYKLEGLEAVNVDTLVRLSASGAWYRSTAQQSNPENMDWISNEDAKNIIDQYVISADSIPWFLNLVLDTLK